MSSQTTVLNNNRQGIVNTTVDKVFIFGNKYGKGNLVYTADDYDDIQINVGTLLGRVHATGKLVPHDSSASDGSQYPVGILAEDVVVEAGNDLDQEVSMCVAGEVNENAVLLADGDDFDTVISAKTLRDRIGADTVGIILRATTENTEHDNS